MTDDSRERKIPLILIAAGVLIYVAAAFARAGSAGVGATLVGVLIGGAIQTALLIAAALVVGTLLKVSFGDLPSAALKFAGAALVSGGIATLIPYGGILALFVFLGLVMWLFEVELTYAVVLTVVYFAVSLAVGFALAAVLR
jgi:hypothetical protein